MRSMKRLWWVPIIFLALLAAGVYQWLLNGLPSPESLGRHLATPSVRITDRNGRLLYEALPQEGGRHTVVPLDSIPLTLQQATIATEDANFYHNPGVDLSGILRAAWIDLRGGEAVAGGSTITQQVARTLLMSPEERGERTLRRKLREVILAWQITRRYSKSEILGFYLNQMYYGAMTYGVEAAAETYFGKPVSDLDLAECAMLAGLTQSPGIYNPFSDLETARSRQQIVLGLMHKAGYITTEQQQLAAAEPLNLASQPYPLQAPHFVMMVRARLDQLFTSNDIFASGGLTVRTTLDLSWQQEAEQAIEQQLERLRHDPKDPIGHNVNNAALVALDPHSGDILAMVGSPDYFDAEHAGAINMTLSPRQPGSALKPLIYADAFDPSRPNPWTPATMMLDVRTSFATHEGRAYVPENYDGLEHGPVLVREALASSLNIPAVIALNHLGLPDLFAFAGRLGITTLGDPNHADLSIALGGGEVRLLDLTAAYGAFASSGFKVDPVAILDVTGNDGRRLYTAPSKKPERVLDERVAWLISDILSDDAARMLGFGANSVLRLDRPAAVKTGTTTNFHDNWTVGYTPDLVVGVWAGNTSHNAMRNVTGLTGAAPIWHQFMRAVLAGRPETAFTRPAGIVQAEVCRLSGLLPTPACPYQKQEWFIDGTQPKEPDHFHVLVNLDTATGKIADKNIPPERISRQVVMDLPPQAEAWARGRGLRLLSDVVSPVQADEAAGTKPKAALAILSPVPQAVYQLAGSIPTSDQQIAIQAAGDAGLSGVRLLVDGTALSLLPGQPLQAWWTLSPGPHTAWAEAVLPSGERVESEKVKFTVLDQDQ